MALLLKMNTKVKEENIKIDNSSKMQIKTRSSPPPLPSCLQQEGIITTNPLCYHCFNQLLTNHFT